MKNRTTIDCPYCGEEIYQGAIKCKHCMTDLGTPLQKQETRPKREGLQVKLSKSKITILLVTASLLVVIGIYLANSELLLPKEVIMSLEDRLNTLPANDIIELDNTLVYLSDLGLVNISQVFQNTYQIMLVQPLDHNNLEGSTFEQKIYLSYVDPYAPVIVVTDGYDSRLEVSELAALLNCNQIIIEHRYFGDSKPEPVDWQYLNSFQAASDVNRVIELFKPVFKGKWISTGVSKGGVTAYYHSYYYPDDVDISVSYVAPLTFSTEDERIYDFVDSIGTEECRSNIYEFQKILLEKKDKIYPMMLDDAENSGWTFDRIGGSEIAFEMAVLEFEFSFWHRGKVACEGIPIHGSDTEIYEYFSRVVALDFFSDQQIEIYEPYYYQSMTELGFFGYRFEKFEGLLEYASDSNLPDFFFKAPLGVEMVFDYEHNLKVYDYLVNKAENFLFIYGENDTWTAAAIELVDEHTNSIVIIKEDGDHGTNIINLDAKDQEIIFLKLAEWLDYDPAQIKLNAATIKDNLVSGNGSYTWSDGSNYVGEFKDGKFHGQGTITYADGDKYVGEFKDDMYYGQGTLTCADGDKYVGEFKDDLPNGQGTLTWSNGDKYVGEFKYDVFHGRGKFTYAGGRIYVGEFKEGVFHGLGMLIYADGSKYVGDFQEGNMHGQGTYTWSDGRKYVGEFQENTGYGQGTMTWADGSVQTGSWENGEYVN